jgi:hypothetical protein
MRGFRVMGRGETSFLGKARENKVPIRVADGQVGFLLPMEERYGCCVLSVVHREADFGLVSNMEKLFRVRLVWYLSSLYIGCWLLE